MNANVAAPGPVGGTERVPVVWRNRTVHIEYQWIAPERSDAPLVVFLHEGLGSVAMWKDFPRQLCDAGGLRGLVFSRPAYGRSTPRTRTRCGARTSCTSRHMRWCLHSSMHWECRRPPGSLATAMAHRLPC